MTPTDPATMSTPAMRMRDPTMGPASPPLVSWSGVTRTLHFQWGTARATISTTIQTAGAMTRRRATTVAPRNRTSRIRRPRVLGKARLVSVMALPFPFLGPDRSHEASRSVDDHPGRQVDGHRDHGKDQPGLGQGGHSEAGAVGAGRVELSQDEGGDGAHGAVD